MASNETPSTSKCQQSSGYTEYIPDEKTENQSIGNESDEPQKKKETGVELNLPHTPKIEEPNTHKEDKSNFSVTDLGNNKCDSITPSKSGKSKQTRRGPAPFASFEDVPDDSSPESKPIVKLENIDEHDKTTDHLDQPLPLVERRASDSQALQNKNTLVTPSTPRIDISRASSSSHQDSRDSSPEMALFADKEKDKSKLEGFREDGALDLRSSTEELTFLEADASATEKEVPKPISRISPLMFNEPLSRKHSRKDSFTSDIALLSISGRQSRVSSIGSQGSAHSNISAQSHLSNITHVSAQSRLSVISGVSRSPSPHKMLLETSFCGPKPIETEPEIMTTDVTECKLLGIATESYTEKTDQSLDDRQFSRPGISVEAVVESARKYSIPTVTKTEQRSTDHQVPDVIISPDIKELKERSNNQLRTMQNKQTEIENRQKKINKIEEKDHQVPEVYSSKNKSKDIIRIKLKPDEEYDDDDDESDKTLMNQDIAKPVTLNLTDTSKKSPQHFSALVQTTDLNSSSNSCSTERRQSLKKRVLGETSKATPSKSSPSKKNNRKDFNSRTPSPSAGASVSRKSSFCSLFKSKDHVTSPDSPAISTVKRKSDDVSRSRTKSRDKSTTPTSGTKTKGSMLSLFKTQRKDISASAPTSRDTSPVIHAAPVQRQTASANVHIPRGKEKLMYYQDAKDGVIHIPLHTPPDDENETTKVEPGDSQQNFNEIMTMEESTRAEISLKRQKSGAPQTVSKPITRTVLEDGSIIIPLHSPTEKINKDVISEIDTITQITTEVAVSVESYTEKVCEPICLSKIITTPNVQTSTYVPDVCMTSTLTTSTAGRKKKEHFTFTTKVGSREQVFSTQLSLTKTPSVTSEQSELLSFQESLKDDDIKNSQQSITSDAGKTGIDAVSTKESLNFENTASSFLIGNDKLKESKSELNIEKCSEDVSRQDSSESEVNSESGGLNKSLLEGIIAVNIAAEEIEKRGLVITQDSFEDELPYVPTTLPLERSVAIPIVPVKDRQTLTTEMKMFPVDRPRSTTSVYPSSLEDYLTEEPKTPDHLKSEKMKISLPKNLPEKCKNPRNKSPGRKSSIKQFDRAFPSTPPRKGSETSESLTRKGSNASEFSIRKGSMTSDLDRQPQLPPRAPVPKPPQWINFEDVPERRKMPKRIQTIPRHSSEEQDEAGVVYNYVNPEDCKCECHETARAVEKQEDEEPLLAGSVESDDGPSGTRREDRNSSGSFSADYFGSDQPGPSGRSLARSKHSPKDSLGSYGSNPKQDKPRKH